TLLQADGIVSAVGKELRKIYPGVKIDADMVQGIIINDVIKRDALTGERAELAQKQVKKYYRKLERQAKKQKAVITPQNQSTSAPTNAPVKPKTENPPTS
ncbi:MAG: hypothetical protein Q7J68_07830, partial [Thermoplasmata archaeon]|nr:hypothetical protein [Thermoplasmata archaeon]